MPPPFSTFWLRPRDHYVKVEKSTHTVVGKYALHFRRALGSIVMGDLKILSAGVDTLHCSVRGELQDGVPVFLEALKEESQRTKELQVVTWGEQSLW